MVRLAYVQKADGEVVWLHDEGSMTFAQVYLSRPKECRWAIVRVADQVWAIDLFDTRMAGDYDTVMGAHEVFPTVDAAVAACVLRS